MTQPPEKVFFDIAEEVYNLNSKEELDGFRLAKDTATTDAYVNDATKTIVIGLRGTNPKDLNDLLADIRTVTSRLATTTRYKYDKSFVEKIIKEFPGYSIFLAGHSLGGAMATQLKRDFPQIKTAVEFNPAFQTRDFVSSPANIVRIYSSRDPLYLAGGRLLATRVIKAGSMNPLKEHFLSTFDRYYSSGGKSDVEMKASESLAPAGRMEFIKPVAEIFQQKGGLTITKIFMRRNPVDKFIEEFFQYVTLGQWSKVKQKYGYDRFFHLGLLLYLSDGSQYILEKLEVVSLTPYSKDTTPKGSSFRQVKLKSTLTLNDAINNTRKAMGDYKFFTYDSFDNNCQHFSMSVLQSNGLLTERDKEFIYQPVDQLIQELPFYTKSAATGITNLGALFTGVVKGFGYTPQVPQVDPSAGGLVGSSSGVVDEPASLSQETM